MPRTLSPAAAAAGRVLQVDAALPMFPLGSVLYPGMHLPLHVFEDRYRALVNDLLTEPDESRRRLGIVAIREGYELGNHGMQSAHRIGCEALLVANRAYADGRFDIAVVGRRRLRLEAMDTSGDYLVGDVTYLGEHAGIGVVAADEAARDAFERYRQALASQSGPELPDDELPTNPQELSYVLAATASLTLRERQQLLEAPDTAERLRLVTVMIGDELTAMRAVPSLPATDLARTAWSPN